ncbi:MAG: HlyD family efflux transporter periplasmic adaptor subunit [Oscillospiraceae bacterium]|nr:HlyD family efflux transporter periplasmic adaptor subunit [Oscillospiraceae bacterium]
MKLVTKKEDAAAGVKKRPSRRAVILIVLAVLVGAVVLSAVFGRRGNDSEISYTYETAQRRSITATLVGNGILEPADSYTLKTLLEGDILTAGFEEGDMIAKDDILYEIDPASAATGVERAEIARAQNQRRYDDALEAIADLNVTASLSGTISGLTVRAGDTVSTQTPICTIEDTTQLTLTEYYSDEYAGSIYPGMRAAVSIPSMMLALEGTVKSVSGAKRVSETGVSCFAVTVSVENPGAVSTGAEASGTLVGASGMIYPSVSDADGLDAASRTVVYPDVAGTVDAVRMHEGERVRAGETIVLLSNETLSDNLANAADALRDSELSLENQYDALDNYTITAPIDGTIVDKDAKGGEKVSAGETLCVIYDLSYLSVTLDVDELDISQVAVGQRATVTADAVAGIEYEGVVTRIGINGTAGAGVTTYPVTVRVDKTEGLLPGMNVDVSIVVAESENALSVPAASIQRGDVIFIKTADGTTGEGAPEGYAAVKVTTGITDSDYVEITGGLDDGAEIAYIPDDVVAKDFLTMMMGMSQDMMNGDMSAMGGPPMMP